ncbi:hypothetical protein [Bauldia sp.]|uniref:hypothetical protein n=1 Tax=Bauldia sp. TaxID=2575872 RepID=UPI003BA92C0E
MRRSALLGLVAGLGLTPSAAYAVTGPDLEAIEPLSKPGAPDGDLMPQIPADDLLDRPAAPAEPPEDDTAIDIPDEPPVAPTVRYDTDTLPTPVRRLREQILEAANSGDPERLRPIIDANEEPPAFSYNDIGDPIAYLKSISADPEGREILAVLAEMLEAGYVHVGEGTPDEMYVWPYFAHYPVELLTGPQIVELLKIVYPGDYDDMQVYGTYLSYRVGLTPDGTWRYFLTSE